MLLLSFALPLLARSLVVAASPALPSLSARDVEQVGDHVNWNLPNAQTVIAQCYPLNISFSTDRRPCAAYLVYSLNQKVEYARITAWSNDSSNPWDASGGSDSIDYAWDAGESSLSFRAFPPRRAAADSSSRIAVLARTSAVVWFGITSCDGTDSYLRGSGYTVQGSDNSSCLSTKWAADDHYGTSLTGSGGVTTTVVGSLQSSSSQSSYPISTPPPKSNIAVIVGGVVGGLGALAASSLAALFFFRRKRRRGRDGRRGAFEVDGEPKPDDDDETSNGFANVGDSDAGVISPLLIPNYSRPVPVATYASPGVVVAPSKSTPAIQEEVIQERDGGLVEGYQVERVPPTYDDATDATSSPPAPSATRPPFSSQG